ncbi:MAG: DUF2905 domain-containing protein [Synergistales bacterium]|nr:DUF2905 domain-containing protein [Synergistales bacterium]
MVSLGKILIVTGIALLVAGVLAFFIGKAGVPLGRLPGDIVIKKKNVTFVAPLASMLLISVVLSVLISLARRWFQ